MRIALAAALTFAALWFVALRPKPVDIDAPLPATPVESASKPKPGTAKVEDKTAAAKAEVAKSEPKPAVKKVAPKLTGSKAVLADMKAGKTVVLLFYHPSKQSTDDQAVREAVKGVDRHDGKVTVHTATLGKLGQYEAITQTATIESTPTVLVIDRKAQAHVLQGLTVTREIDAVVDSALKISK
jgi:hypothetical protein